MGRAGRPRKFNRKRKRADTGPTPERAEKMKELLGYDVKGCDQDAGTPLNVLVARGMIKRELGEAGLIYGAMYWHTFPCLFAKASSIGELSGKGSISMPREVTDLKEIEREEKFRRYDQILRDLPRNIRKQVHIVAVDWDLPQWFVRAVNGNMTDRDDTDRDDLLTGLSALTK